MEGCQDWLTEALRGRDEGRMNNRLGSISRTEPGGSSPGACGRRSFPSRAWQQAASMLLAYWAQFACLRHQLVTVASPPDRLDLEPHDICLRFSKLDLYSNVN